MQGPVKCIALVTSDYQLLTGIIVYHSSRVSLLCHLHLPSLTLKVASSFPTVHCSRICSIHRDQSYLISIPRKWQMGPRSVILYLAWRRFLILVTQLANGEKSSISSTYSSRIIGVLFWADCLEFQIASGKSVRLVKVVLAERSRFRSYS